MTKLLNDPPGLGNTSMSALLNAATAPGNVAGQASAALLRPGTPTPSSVTGQTLAENYLGSLAGLGNLVGQFAANGSPIAQYAPGLGLVSQVSAAGSAYYHFDLTGNTTQLTGAGGTVLTHYSYLPFGESAGASETIANPFTFAGQYGVASLGAGLYNMRART